MSQIDYSVQAISCRPSIVSSQLLRSSAFSSANPRPHTRTLASRTSRALLRPSFRLQGVTVSVRFHKSWSNVIRLNEVIHVQGFFYVAKPGAGMLAAHKTPLVSTSSSYVVEYVL